MLSFKPEQAAEILHDERSIRLVRLDFQHSTIGAIDEVLAELSEGLVTVTTLSNEHKPKRMTIDPYHMTRLALAWLAFQADCKAAEEKEKAAFQAEIDAVRLRAKAVGAEMSSYLTQMDYYNFTLKWPAEHPLNRYNNWWFGGNTDLSLSDVRSRLAQVEKHVQEAQIEACTEKFISTPERQFERAVAVGAYLTADSDEHNEHTRYWLNFPEGHAFHGFWHQYDELTAGQVEYRLRYVEGVMKQTASK